jgi:hypothetical protein
VFLVLAELLTDAAFFSWGGRIPFIASAALVALGLFIRVKISETPEFANAVEKAERVEVPFVTVLRDHKLSIVLGTLAALATFVLFYIMTVFSLGWGQRSWATRAKNSSSCR